MGKQRPIFEFEPKAEPNVSTYVAPNQKKSLVMSGIMELDEKQEHARFQGEILFCHGYLADPLYNEEGHMNALFDLNPDDPEFWTRRGENADEFDHTNPDDFYTEDELEKDLPRGKRDEATIKKAFKNRGLLKYSPANKYWGYWNDKSNKFKGSDMFAEYFNAVGHDHYFNGSHGLGSNGGHRIDHGISLGYTWAVKNWYIIDKETYDGLEEGGNLWNMLKSDCPAYRPVTVVGHSQGAALAAGVAIGVLYFAMELGWEEIALNIVLLGVNQPVNLTGKTHDDFIRTKKEYWEVDATLPNPLPKELGGIEFLNGLSELFSEKYKKLKHEKGIYEHLKEILTDWSAFKSRIVQFTFPNDRGDLVTRDGDIPGVDSACNPERDTTLYSVEFFKHKVPEKYLFERKKEIIALKCGGWLVIPPYIVNRRFEFTSDGKEEEWGDYRKVVLRWGEAMSLYKSLKRDYEKLRREAKITDVIKKTALNLLKPLVKASKIDMLLNYAALQAADLYAHFSPVGLINHDRVLSDFNYTGDAVGVRSCIFDRIKKVGEKKFYRVDYKVADYEEFKLKSEEYKHQKEKDFIDVKSKKRLVKTSIVNTPYIKNIIDKHVKDPDEKTISDRFTEWFYKYEGNPDINAVINKLFGYEE